MQFLKRLMAALALLSVALAAQAAPFLYVPTSDDHDVTVLSILDTADGSRVGEILPIGAGGVLKVEHGVVFNPAGNRIYVATAAGVAVINAADNQVITLVAAQSVGGMFLNPAGTLLYVSTASGTKVMDTATNTLVGTSDFFDANSLGVAFSPTGTMLFRLVGTGSSNATLEQVDTVTHSIVATVTVGTGNHDIVVNAAGTRVYVSNTYTAATSDLNSISVLDTTTDAVTTIPVGKIPVRLMLNPAGTRLYALTLYADVDGQSTNGGQLVVVDTATNSVIDRIAAGDVPTHMAINPSGTRLYVQSLDLSVDGTSVIAVFDTTCNTVIGKIAQATVGGYFQPLYMAPPTGSGTPPVETPAHVQITGMEVTQGIQDLAGSVPLIGGRRTFVRVYVKSDGPVVSGVTAILSAVGNIACNLPQCPPVGATLVPLVPVNAVGTRIKVGPNPKRYNLDDSFLFELPWAWTQYASLHLHAVVTQGPGLVPTQSCPKDILDTPLTVFQQTENHTLKVQFVRLSYRLPGTFNGVTNAFLQATPAEQGQSESFIRRTYPISNLLPAPDYPLFDAGLGLAVSRIDLECIGAPVDEQDLCARNYISNKLAALQAWTGFMGDADTIYGLIPQVPNDTKSVFFTRGACCTDAVSAGPSDTADYAAHEIGHFFGRQHPVPGAEACGHDAVDANYPYFRSWIAPPFADISTSMAGLDGGDPKYSIPMSVFPTIILGAGTEGHYDIMGYCKPSWISDYTYTNLRVCIVAAHGLPGFTPGCGPAGMTRGPSTPQRGDFLTVFGDITPAQGASFNARRVDRNYSPAGSASGSHRIRLTGAGGATLAEYPFTPDDVADAARVSFGQVVPFVAGTLGIQIVDVTAASKVVGQKAVSPNAPVVSGVALQGAPDPATGRVTLSWNASDADGDTLTYDVFFTRDSGDSLHPLMLGVTEKSTQIDTTSLAGGSAKFRVVATDGVQSGFADSPAFTLANKPPKPQILSPSDGATLHVGQLINIEGTATDPQDGVIASAGLVWSVSGRSIGSGPRLSVTDLPAGVSQVSLTATNSVGLSATTTASVNVKENVDQPGPTLTAGPMQIGWHLGTGESDLQVAPLEIGNSGSGNLDFTAQSSASWLVLSSTTGTTPVTITLTADPAGAAGGTTREATVTLTAAASPAQTIRIPVTLSVGNTFAVSKASATDTTPPPPADFAITASSAAGTVTAGQSAQTALTINPSNGFRGSVSLACSGLPASATCSFSPASPMVDAGAASSTLTISTTTRTAASSRGNPTSPMVPGGALLAAIGMPFAFRRRKFVGARYYAMLAMLLIGTLVLHGCGGGGQSTAQGPTGGGPTGGSPGGSSVGTPTGTYNITITATSGSTVHTTIYVLTVS